MATGTTRDKIWSRAIKLTHRKGEPVSAEQLAQITGASERTARDTLKTMESNYILKERKNGREVSYVEGDWKDL